MKNTRIFFSKWEFNNRDELHKNLNSWLFKLGYQVKCLTHRESTHYISQTFECSTNGPCNYKFLFRQKSAKEKFLFIFPMAITSALHLKQVKEIWS